MIRGSLLLLLLGCGSEEVVPSLVEGKLGSVQLTLGGGGWGWEEFRVSAGNGNEFSPYILHLELTGVDFDPVIPIDGLELEQRHILAQRVALADRLSFRLALTGADDELRAGGRRYETSDGDATVELMVGSLRASDEAGGSAAVSPRSVGSDRGWALTVDELILPESGGAGRIKGLLQLAISRQTVDPIDSLTGDLKITIDLPFVGSWLGRCQQSFLTAPEGRDCPR